VLSINLLKNLNMKNSILILFLGLMLSLASNYQVQAQTIPLPEISTIITNQNPSNPQVEVPKVGFFKKIWDNAKDSGIWVIVMYISGILSKNGVTKIIKKIAGKGTIITQELTEISIASNQFFKLLDGAIADDGTVKQNTLKEAVAAGKTVIAETKEGYKVIIEPTKTAI